MYNNKQIPDYELLAKYLAGEASVEEIQLVEDWINAGNQDEFVKIRSVWIASDSSSKVFDVDKALNNVNSKIFTAEDKNRRKIVALLMAAAAIVLGILIPTLLLNRTGVPESKILSFASQDSIAKIQMQDGSLLTLNADSKIEYSEDFNSNRQVKLSGEAYFEVEHIDNEHKFVVLAKDVEITVVGTKFNVKAIDESDIVEVSVTEGIVNVQQNNNSDYIELKANEKILVNTNTGEATKVNTTNPADIYWMTKKIIFNNSQISEVASALSSVYGVDVEISLINQDSLRLNASFENNSIDEVIKVIELTLDINIEKSGNTLTFKNAE